MQILTPLGMVDAPRHEAERVKAMTDDELKASLYVGKNVDPFVLSEQFARGIYRNTQAQRHGGIAHQLERMGVK